MEEQLTALVRTLVLADLSGADPGAVERAFRTAQGLERERFVFAWNNAMQDDDLTRWIDGREELRRAAEAIALSMAPPDPSPAHSAAALEALERFSAWDRHAYAVIIVPGYTPLGATTASPGVHPVARQRLEQALRAFNEGKAPFIVVSGANVYPRGTPYYEAIEMKKELVRMGMQEERVLVEARARHSTTNLRNAGRIMRKYGLSSALITTKGGGLFGSALFGQDFYFSNPELSMFHRRSEKELGYRVGELTAAGDGRIAFVPSPGVTRFNYKDALDP
jgi:hypothetical protein